MIKAKIVVDPSEPKKALSMITVGKDSPLEAVVAGIPSDMTNVQVHFQTRIGAPYVTYATEALAFGEWNIKVPGPAFPNVGDMVYHITALDSQGLGKWFGSGVCRVMPSVLHVRGGDDPIYPVGGDVYVKNRTNGLYHKLEVDQDEEGNPFPVLQKEGVVI